MAQINHRGAASEQYPPATLLAHLVYSYYTGISSSRRVERSSHTDVALRFVCANTHPDLEVLAAMEWNLVCLADNLKRFNQLLTLKGR
jgi:transposase